MIIVFFTPAMGIGAQKMMVDTIKTQINKDQILTCEAMKDSCQLFIGTEGAIAIAGKAEFIKENPVYNIELILYGFKKILTWNLITPLKPTADKHKYTAKGISINAITGAYKIFDILSID